MPDFSSFVDFSSLFVGLSSILFAVWYPQFQTLLAQPRPPIYRNRKSYIGGLQGAIASKAVPLVAFIGAYAISLSGVACAIFRHTKFTLSPTGINPAATLFVLTYSLSLYLLGYSVVTLFRLIAAWWRAGTDRDSGPRITLLR